MLELSGKSAIVTGASKGIGEGCARELAALGVQVLLAARNLDAIEKIAEEIRQSGGSAQAMQCDVASYDSVSALVKACLDRFGGLDILINNAGQIEPIARLADSDPDQWTKVADVNYKGVYYGMRAAIPVMLEQGGGVIVNVSSGAAVSALEGWSHYCSSKAAALSLTRCGDMEYRDQGIRVVGLSPGTVATDMQVAIKASGINPVSQLDPTVHIPASWAGRAAAWLCTEAAAGFAGGDFSLRDDDNRRLVGLVE